MRDRVLIVDDVEINREILKEILQDEYKIMQAGDGEEALQVIEQNQEDIAVVLLDLIMPKKDGYEVLEVLKKNKWLDNMAVLIISGESSVETEARCFDYGISDFIRKPFDNNLVRQRVRNVVELFLYKNHLEDKLMNRQRF